MKDMVRVAVTSPRVHIGNVTRNVEEILSFYNEYSDKADIVVTPELSMTGYTCQDLFANRNLLNKVSEGLLKLCEEVGKPGGSMAALVVGLPFEYNGELYNCAAFISG